MKRVISIAMAVLMIAALFVGCAGSGPAGKYVVKSIDGKTVDEMLDETAQSAGMSKEDLMKQMNITSAEEIITMELKDDGTATMVVNMLSSTKTGTWKQEGNTVAITIDGETSNFTLNGNELSNSEGEQTYVFVKK